MLTRWPPDTYTLGVINQKNNLCMYLSMALWIVCDYLDLGCRHDTSLPPPCTNICTRAVRWSDCTRIPFRFPWKSKVFLSFYNVFYRCSPQRTKIVVKPCSRLPPYRYVVVGAENMVVMSDSLAHQGTVEKRDFSVGHARVLPRQDD